MYSMFYQTNVANPDVSNWDTSQVENMIGMFAGADNANPDVSNWDVSQVVDMSSMFEGASSANPDLTNWRLLSIASLSNAFTNSGLSTENYTAFLDSLSSQPNLPNNITMSIGPKYNASAQTTRDYLVNVLGWFIEDGGVAP